jgi:hypothetical protein
MTCWTWGGGGVRVDAGVVCVCGSEEGCRHSPVVQGCRAHPSAGSVMCDQNQGAGSTAVAGGWPWDMDR